MFQSIKLTMSETDPGCLLVQSKIADRIESRFFVKLETKLWTDENKGKFCKYAEP